MPAKWGRDTGCFYNHVFLKQLSMAHDQIWGPPKTPCGLQVCEERSFNLIISQTLAPKFAPTPTHPVAHYQYKTGNQPLTNNF